MRFLCLEYSGAFARAAPDGNAKCLKTFGYFPREMSLMIAATALRKSIGVVTSKVFGANGFNVRASESSIEEPITGPLTIPGFLGPPRPGAPPGANPRPCG